MDGPKRRCWQPLELRQEFVGFRLERQVLVRVYELVVPLFLQDEAEADSSPVAERERIAVPLAKGA
jgi:hypothetical protein